MKQALEKYWAGKIPQTQLIEVSHTTQSVDWRLQADAGITRVGIDGSLYDQVLDTTFMLGLAPTRFKEFTGLDLYFAMARGAPGVPAMDMSKFFDTNYHYLVSFVSSSFACGWHGSAAGCTYSGLGSHWCSLLGQQKQLLYPSSTCTTISITDIDCFAVPYHSSPSPNPSQVPELEGDFSVQSLNFIPLLEKVDRAQKAVGKERAIPMLIGPVTYVLLSKRDLPLADAVDR